jgi:hypothetical protein
MIDLEFRSRAILPEKVGTLTFRDVGDSVLYHSLIELASVGSIWSIWSEMATQPRESHNVLEADANPTTSSKPTHYKRAPL